MATKRAKPRSKAMVVASTTRSKACVVWKEPQFKHAITLSKRDFTNIPAKGALSVAVDEKGRWWIAERLPGGPEPQFIPIEAFWEGERGHILS